MSQTSGYFDISASFIGHAYPKDSDHAFATGSINSVRKQQRNIYDQELVGKTSLSSSVDKILPLHHVDIDPTLVSWTQVGIGKKHGFVIPALSSSDHEVSRLNAYTSGTFALETSAVPASASAYYSKASRFVKKIYKLSASLSLPLLPASQNVLPSSIETVASRSFFDPVSGSYRACDMYNPAVFEIDIPDYGRIRDLRVWVELVHDIRQGTGSLTGTWGGTGDNSLYKKGGLQNLQISLRSPNVVFPYAHPLWNDSKTYGYTFRPDVNLDSTHQQVPEILKNSYLLWAGHSAEDELGISVGNLTSSVSNPAYIEFDTDIDMRTIFSDASPFRNPRNISPMFPSADELSVGIPHAPIVKPGLGQASLLNLSANSPNENFISVANAADPNWRSLNQGLGSDSNVYQIVADFNRPNVFYASGDGGASLYKTSDGGLNWVGINDSVLTSLMFIETIALDYGNSLIVYAGTSGNGLFRSMDGGISWKNIGDLTFSSSFTVYQIQVDPGNSDIVYANAGWNFNSGIASPDKTTERPIYRTTNARSASPSWKAMFDTVLSASYEVEGLALLTGSGGGLLALVTSASYNVSLDELDETQYILRSLTPSSGTGNWTKISDPLLSGSYFYSGLLVDTFSGYAYFQSYTPFIFATYGGFNWKIINSGSFPLNSTSAAYNLKGFINPLAPENLYYANLNNSPRTISHIKNASSVFSSTPQWESISTGSGLPATVFVFGMSIDPYATSSFFAGMNIKGIYKLNENTSVWSASSQGLSVITTECVLVDKTDNQHILLGAGAGLYVTFNGGANWILTNPSDAVLSIASFTNLIDVSPNGNLQNIFALLNGSPQQSTDGGLTWTPRGLGFNPDDELNFMYVDPKHPGVMYITGLDESFSGAVTSRSLYKSVNSGTLFTRIFSSGSRIISPGFLAIDPVNTDILYFTNPQSVSVWKSVDAGQNWSALTDSNISTSSFNIGARVNSIAIDPLNHSTVYFGKSSGNNRLFKSLDGGQTTFPIGNSGSVFLGSSSILSIVIDPVANNTIYCITNGSNGFARGVFVSYDGGNSFSQKNNGINTGSAGQQNSFFIDPVDDSILYLSDANGFSKFFPGGTFYSGMTASPTGSNIPWMLDDRIPPGALYDGLRKNRFYSFTGSLINSGALVPAGWLSGQNNSASVGEFPTFGYQIGPESIQAVYPMLDDVFVQKMYDETQIPPGIATVPSSHPRIIGYRPGLRGSEIHGKWKLMISVGSGYSGSLPYGTMADARAGIWFRQFRIEAVVDQGRSPVSMTPSHDRRFRKQNYVPQRSGKRRVEIISGSAEWDVGINYVFVEQTQEYGRSIGIMDHTGSNTDFAVFTRITGALADYMSLSGAAALNAFLSNEFGTPFIPISSGSSISPSFTFFDPASDSAKQNQAKREIAKLLNPNQSRSPAPYLKSALGRAGIFKQARDKLFTQLDSLGLQGSSTGSIG